MFTTGATGALLERKRPGKGAYLRWVGVHVVGRMVYRVVYARRSSPGRPAKRTQPGQPGGPCRPSSEPGLAQSQV